eukprot:m.47445 g.47445  ORF g.47445 m.47445 type:complete len:109 (-) comp10501_c0_seq2:882-1208(-)
MLSPLVLVLVNSVLPLSASAPLTLLPSSKGRCMDGTPPGYYYAPATAPASTNNWIIELEGGGDCATQDSCESKVHNHRLITRNFTNNIFATILIGRQLHICISHQFSS